MNCPRCGAKIEKGWEYCPMCGMNLRRRNDLFSGFFDVGKIFDRFEKMMHDEISKSFEKDFEVFDLRPLFRKPIKGKSSGFTIKITRVGDREPKVSVNTFGDVDKKAVKEEVRNLAEDAGIDIRQPPAREQETKELPIPKYTEEPRTSVKRLDSKVLVEIDIPGVDSDDNIRVNELENSVEVKAIAGDKAYFKILTKPEQFKITRKEFRKGKLLIEFS